MKHSKVRVWCIAAVFACAPRLFAVAPEASPFQSIAVANIFRLREPEKPKPIDKPQPPLPPIGLTGIVDGYGKLFALLEVSPPNQAKMFLKLERGQREGEIEVLNLDIKAGIAEVNISGTVTNLVLNRNPSAPPPTATKPSLTTGAVPAPLPSQPQLSRDESALIIEAERERLRQAGDPMANIMPITHLTPAGAPGTDGSELKSTGTDTGGPSRKRAIQPR
jgi:hypothetical protein